MFMIEIKEDGDANLPEECREHFRCSVNVSYLTSELMEKP